MPTDLRQDRTLESRPRLKATCIKLHDMAIELGPEAKLPTITELRAELGVSIYTLNDAVRELERRQILRSINGVGIYVTPRQKMLTGNIGLIGSESLHQQHTNYHGRLMQGIEKAARANKQHLLFLGTDLDWEVSSCEKVDGVLVAGIDQTNSLVQKLPATLPVVAVLIAAKGISNVTADDHQGAMLAVQYLMEKGHRRIACLMEKTPVLPRCRLAGYQETLQNSGITINPDWIRLTPPVQNRGQHKDINQCYVAWGRAHMQAWLREGWRETNCTAIFVQNEASAIGVMQVLQEEGIQVPQQISVMGFDGTQLCDYVTPRLCAVQVPLAQIGAKAVELLNRQIQNGMEEPQSIALPLQIREGDSVTSI